MYICSHTCVYYTCTLVHLKVHVHVQVHTCIYCACGYTLGMGDYENMSQRLLFLQVSRLLQLLATLHMYVDFIQQSN